MKRTPDELIDEILLVDDGSDMPHLGAPLDEDVYVSIYRIILRIIID